MRELSLHILDIVQNSLEAGSDEVEIEIIEALKEDRFMIIISDNGRGIKKEKMSTITDPFVTSRSVRDIGLGLPLLHSAAKHCGGSVKISSNPGQGTVVKAEFIHSHIDRAPLGNIADTMISLIAVNPEVEFKLIYAINEKRFIFNTHDVKMIMGDIKINHYSVLNWIKEYLEEGIENLCGGELDEVTGRITGIKK